MKRIIGLVKERFFYVVIASSLFFLIATVLLPIWRLFPEITETVAIPLHKNVHTGVDLFGPWERIFTIPIISGIIFVVNTILSLVFWKRDHVISHMFLLVGLIAQILAFISMIFVVLLNLAYA